MDTNDLWFISSWVKSIMLLPDENHPEVFQERINNLRNVLISYFQNTNNKVVDYRTKDLKVKLQEEIGNFEYTSDILTIFKRGYPEVFINGKAVEQQRE